MLPRRHCCHCLVTVDIARRAPAVVAAARHPHLRASLHPIYEPAQSRPSTPPGFNIALRREGGDQDKPVQDYIRQEQRGGLLLDLDGLC